MENVASYSAYEESVLGLQIALGNASLLVIVFDTPVVSVAFERLVVGFSVVARNLAIVLVGTSSHVFVESLA